MSTAIIPAKQLTVIPKPTKAEVVAALVELRIEKLRKQITERDAQIAALKAECKIELTAHFREVAQTAEPNLYFGQRGWNGNSHVKAIIGANASIQFPKLPSALEKKMVRLDELERTRFPIDPAQIKREIQRGILGIGDTRDRITRLLNDKESRAVLTEMLEKMETA